MGRAAEWKGDRFRILFPSLDPNFNRFQYLTGLRPVPPPLASGTMVAHPQSMVGYATTLPNLLAKDFPFMNIAMVLYRAQRRRILLLVHAGHTVMDIAERVDCARPPITVFPPFNPKKALAKHYTIRYNLNLESIDECAYSHFSPDSTGNYRAAGKRPISISGCRKAVQRRPKRG